MMGTQSQGAFVRDFLGPEGAYTARFDPAAGSDGAIDVTIGGIAMRWTVEVSQIEEDDLAVISGMTRGSEPLWGDQYWFELRLGDRASVIRYWGDRVLIREDKGS